MTTITTESHISPQFLPEWAHRQKGIVDEVECLPGVGASLSSDVSRVAARCGLQREDWGGGGGPTQEHD